MLFRLDNFAKSMIKNTVGTYRGLPRILNKDKGVLDINGTPTGLYILGYAKVSPLASTPWARIKVHKGWFFCEQEDISSGDIILDRVDNAHYFVMSVKNEVLSDQTTYLDGTLHFCDSKVKIERFQDGVRDTFGRVASPAPIEILAEAWATTNALNFDVMEQQDRLIAQDKIKVYLQPKTGVSEADRLTIIGNGEKYKVISIDKTSIIGLWICSVDVDVR